MIEHKNVSVSLAPELFAFATARVQSGSYSSVSDVVRAGLRLLGEREQGIGHPRPQAALGTMRPHG